MKNILSALYFFFIFTFFHFISSVPNCHQLQIRSKHNFSFPRWWRVQWFHFLLPDERAQNCVHAARTDAPCTQAKRCHEAQMAVSNCCWIDARILNGDARPPILFDAVQELYARKWQSANGRLHTSRRRPQNSRVMETYENLVEWESTTLVRALTWVSSMLHSEINSMTEKSELPEQKTIWFKQVSFWAFLWTSGVQSTIICKSNSEKSES